jgi:hypothetical protein
MNPSPPPKSRLQLVREQAARGQLRDDAIQRTRLVVSIDKLVEELDQFKVRYRGEVVSDFPQKTWPHVRAGDKA